ncbi:MAG: glycosyltransferase [Paludibacteraceae bacterium]
MKILLVIDDYISSNNGTTISCRRFAEELRRQGHEVRVLGTSLPDEPDMFRLEEYHLPIVDGLVRANDFHFSHVNMEVLRKAVAWADVVHCMMPFMLTYRTEQVCKELHKPTTAAFHIQPENLLSAVRLGKFKPIVDLLYYMWRVGIYNKFRYIHCPSAFMRQEMIAHGYTGDIRAISNGISSAFCQQEKKKNPKAEGKIVITMVGRLAREKRQDVILRAVQKSKYADRIQVVFAGKGPLESWYKRLGKRLSNPPMFVYLNQQDLMELLRQTDLYVHASDMESEAISCIEAFATGLVPIISDSDKSATRQFALDGRSLFQAGESSDLAAKIDYWIDHPAEKRRMERAYAKQGLDYTLEASVRKCVQMFEEAVDSMKD